MEPIVFDEEELDVIAEYDEETLEQFEDERCLNIIDEFKDEIINFKIKSKKAELNFEKDEHPREGLTLDALSRLKPVFKKDGTVTAGNSSGLNDGAAAMLLASENGVTENNLNPIAKIGLIN